MLSGATPGGGFRPVCEEKPRVSGSATLSLPVGWTHENRLSCPGARSRPRALGFLGPAGLFHHVDGVALGERLHLSASTAPSVATLCKSDVKRARSTGGGGTQTRNVSVLLCARLHRVRAPAATDLFPGASWDPGPIF